MKCAAAPHARRTHSFDRNPAGTSRVIFFYIFFSQLFELSSVPSILKYAKLTPIRPPPHNPLRTLPHPAPPYRVAHSRLSEYTRIYIQTTARPRVCVCVLQLYTHYSILHMHDCCNKNKLIFNSRVIPIILINNNNNNNNDIIYIGIGGNPCAENVVFDFFFFLVS